jgi:hypothetical protein
MVSANLSAIRRKLCLTPTSTRSTTAMKHLRDLLLFLRPSAAALAATFLAGCYAYHPGGYYGATTGTGDGKGTQATEK